MHAMSNNNMGNRYIALSPFGKEIVTLDCATHILKTWRVILENEVTLVIPTNFECTLRDDIGIKTDEINWSLAISDADSDGNTLIALSCSKFNKVNKAINIVTENENPPNLITKGRVVDTNDVANVATKILNSIQICSIRVVSTSGNVVWHKIKKFYGFLQFFQGNMLLISNHLGIIRGLCIDNKSDIDYLTNLHDSTSPTKRRSKLKNVNIYEEYWKPIYIIEKPSYMDLEKKESNLKYVRYAEKWESYHIIEKPPFIHNDLDYARPFNKNFKKYMINYHEQQESYDEKEKKFYEIFGYPNYFIENLEVMSDEEKLNIIQNCIVGGKFFINNEENNIEMYNLLSRNMDMLFHHSNFQPELTNNIFAISKNAKLLAVTIDNNSVALYLNENSLNIAKKSFTFSSAKLTHMAFFNDDEKLLLLKEDKIQKYLIIWNIFEDSDEIYSINKKVQIIDLFGTIAFVNDPGDIGDIQLGTLRKFEMKQEISEIKLSQELKLSEKMIDNVFDTEPWLCLDHYQTSYWLDHDKTTRISFGFYTIQIWKNDELIYIRSANHYSDDDYDSTEIMSIPNVELLDISQNDNGNIISTFKCNDDKYEFQVNKLASHCFTKDHIKDAINTLNFFYKLKSSKISYKQPKINKFIEKTKGIIYNIINNKPDLWRLLDVRYNLMEDLIRNQLNDIIKFILNSDNCNQKLHIPQFYKWNGEKKSICELSIALEDDNIEILQRLVNYYSCNAIENAGWMITVTQVLPKLNKKFPEYVIKLIDNPVFHQKQMHLTKSRIKSFLASNPSCTTFIVDTRLPLLSKKVFLNQPFRKYSKYSNDNLNEDIEIRMIPLPDFNKFIEIHGYKQIVRSPFFEFMSQNHSHLIYNNTIIEAIINFHWKSRAYRQAIPRLLSTILYFGIINIHLLLFSFSSAYKNISEYYRVGSIIASLNSMRTLNFASLDAERTFYYYIFHLFNHVLIFLSLYLFDYYSNSNVLVIFATFTMLLLWIEIVLFLRIIPVIGEYILIIIFLVSKVIPYFLTLMIMMFGFSLPMFMIFSNAAILGIKPDGDKYSFVQDPSKSDANQFSNITLEQQIDSPSFLETLEMVYLLLFGNWDVINKWNIYSIQILAILASLFLIIIMQNIFVALMTEAISTTRRYRKIASLRSKADCIIQFDNESYASLRNIWSCYYISTESSFNFRFYHLPTFNAIYDRHIFYTINKNDTKNWTIIDDNEIDNNDLVINTTTSKDMGEIIEKLSDKQLILENEVQKINEKFDKLLELLDKK